MTGWRELLNALTTMFRWWFIVQPWEQGIRVRAGKYTRVVCAGWYWMLPYVDRVYIQNTRRRLTVLPTATISTLDGKAVTIGSCVGYCIKDTLKLQQSLHHGEETIRLLVAGLLSEFVVSRRLEDCTAGALLEHVKNRIDLSKFGLADAEFLLTDFVVVRTYRLISGNSGHWTTGDALNTTRTFDAPAER